MFKSLGSKINTFIQQGCIKLIKSESKDFYNVTKDYISNKCCSFELSISQRILEENVSKYEVTVFNIDDNQKCFLSSKSAY